MFAVLAATLSLVCIFLPVVFMQGMVGRFFQNFAVVMVAGVLVSWFVALSLTPMMCARYLNVETSHGRVYRFFEASFERLETLYRKMIVSSLNHTVISILITLGIIFSSVYFFQNVGKEFNPREDEGRIMIFAKAPLGSSLEYTKERLKFVEDVVRGQEGVAYGFTAIGLFPQAQISDALGFVTMLPQEYRDIKQWEAIDQLREKLSNIPGFRVFASEPPRGAQP